MATTAHARSTLSRPTATGSTTSRAMSGSGRPTGSPQTSGSATGAWTRPGRPLGPTRFKRAAPTYAMRPTAAATAWPPARPTSPAPRQATSAFAARQTPADWGQPSPGRAPSTVAPIVLSVRNPTAALNATSGRGDHFQFSTNATSSGTNSVTFSNNTLIGARGSTRAAPTWAPASF